MDSQTPSTSTATIGNNKTFKVCVIGPPAVGKTAFITRHSAGVFQQEYVATMGAKITPLIFYISSKSHPEIPSRITLNMWDIGGVDSCGLTTQTYLIGTDAVIALFDSREVKEVITQYLDKIPTNTPTVVCSTKYDIRGNHYLHGGMDKFPIWKEVAGRDVAFYQISSKYGGCLEKPILRVIRKIFNIDDIKFGYSDNASCYTNQ